MPDEKPSTDVAPERLAKLLPADLTAAFLSAKAGLLAALGDPTAGGAVFWTFVGILLVSPFYFRWVVKAKTGLEVTSCR
jgi:hypothetical protein